MLLKQDEVAELETKLDAIDREETRRVFLGCRRMHGNPERQITVAKLDQALAQYGEELDWVEMVIHKVADFADELLERSHRILGLESALRRHPNSLKNWISNNPDLARDETTYLDVEEDLCYAAASYDNEFNDLQHLLSNMARRL